MIHRRIRYLLFHKDVYIISWFKIIKICNNINAV